MMRNISIVRIDLIRARQRNGTDHEIKWDLFYCLAPSAAELKEVEIIHKRKKKPTPTPPLYVGVPRCNEFLMPSHS
jgi:hypothetical protein